MWGERKRGQKVPGQLRGSWPPRCNLPAVRGSISLESMNSTNLKREKMKMSQTQVLAGKEFESEVLQSSQPVLVDFYAPWCGPCRILGPVIDRLAEQFDGRAKVFKVNVEDESELADVFEIRGVPALLLFKDGEVVDRIVGLTPPEELASKLERLLKPVAAA
jgi:thioredoxin 1